MKLLPKWKFFKINMENYVKEADELVLLEFSDFYAMDYNEIFNKINLWIFKVHGYLKDSFDNSKNEFAASFYFAKLHGLFIKTEKTQSMQKIVEAFEELKSKRRKLEYILHLLSVCDLVIQNKFIDLNIRAKYSKKEIQDLVLDKLYYLQDSFYYPLHTILQGNGIYIRNNNELDIAKSLEDKGLIWADYSGTITVQLSEEGRKNIRKKRHFDFAETKTVTKPSTTIDSVITDEKAVNNEFDYGKNEAMNEIPSYQSQNGSILQKSRDRLFEEKMVNIESTKVVDKDKIQLIFKTTSKTLKSI